MSEPTQVSPNQFSKEIIEIIGLKEMTYCCFIFDWANNKPVRANVEFVLNEKQVRKLLDLMKDGSWKETVI